jgi:hypothetical protein
MTSRWRPHRWLREAILAFMSSRQQWSGTSTELLAELNQHADEEKRKPNERNGLWPTSARLLSNALRRLAPNLKVAGIEITFIKIKGTRTVQLEKRGNSSPSSSPVSPHAENTRHNAENQGDDEIPRRNSSSPQNPAPQRGKSGEGEDEGAQDDESPTHSKDDADPNFCRVYGRLLPNAATRAVGMHRECADEVDELLLQEQKGA